MAKNYLHEGWTITVPAPTGGVHSGDAILVGGFFGVANYDAEQTLPVEITLGGGNCRRPRPSRPHPERSTVPSASDAERPVPDARRNVTGRPEE
jgi:hypothetical protein